MHRKLKFRVWDPDTNRFLDGSKEFEWGHAISLDGEVLDILDYEAINYDYYKNPIISQFTGLLDQDGNEIWEGDILKIRCPFTGGITNQSVTYMFGMFGIYTSMFSGLCHSKNLIFTEDEKRDLTNKIYCNVLGNLYQNPELLESK